MIVLDFRFEIRAL